MTSVLHTQFKACSMHNHSVHTENICKWTQTLLGQFRFCVKLLHTDLQRDTLEKNDKQTWHP